MNGQKLTHTELCEWIEIFAKNGDIGDHLFFVGSYCEMYTGDAFEARWDLGIKTRCKPVHLCSMTRKGIIGVSPSMKRFCIGGEFQADRYRRYFVV